MEKNETPKNLALLTADEVTLSILEVDAEGVRIKLWPDVNAVRAHLEECCERMPGGLAGYSVRHYVCGRYLYCAVALADITKDAPCPSTYRVSSDAPTNEADGSFLAAAAAWSIGAGVLNLPPLRIRQARSTSSPRASPAPTSLSATSWTTPSPWTTSPTTVTAAWHRCECASVTGA